MPGKIYEALTHWKERMAWREGLTLHWEGPDQAVVGQKVFTSLSGFPTHSFEFKITGLTGSSHDDANLDANVSGSNDQSYTASFSGLAAGTNFSDGDFTVAPGQTEVGYVSFELPNSVQVGAVTWDPNLDGAIATWKVQ